MMADEQSAEWWALVNLGACIKAQADRLGIEHEGVPLEGIVARIADAALAHAAAEPQPAMYAWGIYAAAWNNDPYYVASRSGSGRELTVIAEDWEAAKAEAEKILPELNRSYHWRYTQQSCTDVRMTSSDAKR